MREVFYFKFDCIKHKHQTFYSRCNIIIINISFVGNSWERQPSARSSSNCILAFSRIETSDSCKDVFVVGNSGLCCNCVDLDCQDRKYTFIISPCVLSWKLLYCGLVVGIWIGNDQSVCTSLTASTHKSRTKSLPLCWWLVLLAWLKTVPALHSLAISFCNMPFDFVCKTQKSENLVYNLVIRY